MVLLLSHKCWPLDASVLLFKQTNNDINHLHSICRQNDFQTVHRTWNYCIQTLSTVWQKIHEFLLFVDVVVIVHQHKFFLFFNLFFSILAEKLTIIFSHKILLMFIGVRRYNSMWKIFISKRICSAHSWIFEIKPRTKNIYLFQTIRKRNGQNVWNERRTAQRFQKYVLLV